MNVTEARNLTLKKFDEDGVYYNIITEIDFLIKGVARFYFDAQINLFDYNIESDYDVKMIASYYRCCGFEVKIVDQHFLVIRWD